MLYITPDKGKVWVAIVLGEQAFGIAMSSSLPAALNKMFSETKPYAEGRGIRFPVNSISDIPLIAKLVDHTKAKSIFMLKIQMGSSSI